MRRVFLVLLFAFFAVPFLFAQEIGIGEPETLLVRKRQWDIYGTIHTNGFGVGTQFGREHTIYLRSGVDIEYTYYRHFKEQRLRADPNTVLVYGKLNYFGMLRGGYGLTRILNAKPYWGGVEVSYFFYGGISLGFSVPVYLHIAYPIMAPQTERYNPEIHNWGNIIDKASFWEGVSSIKLHPGLYVKTGLSFDFAKSDADIIKLDIGAAADVYMIPVEKMAFSPKQYVLLTGYLTFHFGKKRANYE